MNCWGDRHLNSSALRQESMRQTKQASATRVWGAAEATAKWEVVGTLPEKDDNSPRSTGMFAQSGSVLK